jgi:succinate dehydrogenase/fumarate reductase flavoprotein subunit
MTTLHEYMIKEGHAPEWPYPVKYGEEKKIVSDVLVIGGGIAGCHAAVSAAKHGAKVAVIDRGNAKRSGMGGVGVDHWHGACTNPCSKVTPEDYTLATIECTRGYTNGLVRYIIASEGWDTLLDSEKMGMRIRDVDDEFKGAAFRDDETKLMFAYDYKSRHMLKVWGHNHKPSLYKEMKRLGVDTHNRIVATSLLTEKGKQGARVIGATGVNTRTGEFYIFRAKATIIATGSAGRLWQFAPQLTASSSMSDLNNVGMGHVIGWNAGAEFVQMEESGPGGFGLGYAPYSMGNPGNTFFGTPIVDNNGKEIPWFDVFGQEIKTQEDRFVPSPGQPFVLGIGIGVNNYIDKYFLNDIATDIPERILKGELVLPLYADMTLMPEVERRVIYGMMVGNEGKTRIPIYDTMTKAGFNPDKDMLQVPINPLETYRFNNYWIGVPFPAARGMGGGGFLVDWDLRTTLEGLYAAGGSPIFNSGCHGESATTGRYSGRKAAAYARTATDSIADRKQIEGEKARIYAPLKHRGSGIGWMEINAAIARIMQDYCGKYKNETTLKLGLRLFKELRETEGSETYVANPHELGRLIECYSLISLGEMIMHASLVRKASSKYLDFYRLDYPELDPPSWQKFLPMKLKGNKVISRELPFDYHLKPPYASTYQENYKVHCVI